MDDTRVEYKLLNIKMDSTVDNKVNIKGLISPEGTIIFYGMGFRRDLMDYTCIPLSLDGVQHFRRIGLSDKLLEVRNVITTINPQLSKVKNLHYPRLEEIAPDEIPIGFTGIPFKGYIIYPLFRDPDIAYIAILTIGDNEIHCIYFNQKRVIFRRLDQEVELDCSFIPDGERFTLLLEWSYNYIKIYACWVDSTGMERSRENRKDFSSLLMPAPYARALWYEIKDEIKDIDPEGRPLMGVRELRRAYKDMDDFCRTIADLFSEVNKIFDACEPSAFWDEPSKSKKTPKKETKSRNSLKAFLASICANKNIQIFREDPTRSGNVDFVFVGIGMDHTSLNVVLEIKNAHSQDLIHGLTNQLPKYITDRGNAVGFYGVLWFKCKHCPKPSDTSINECYDRLIEFKPDMVRDILFLDLSLNESASKH